MKTNKISAYHPAYQTSFQKKSVSNCISKRSDPVKKVRPNIKELLVRCSIYLKCVGKGIPKSVAQTIETSKNIRTLLDNYSLRFSKSKKEDYPDMNRLILDLSIRKRDPANGKPEGDPYVKEFAAKNKKEMCERIEQLCEKEIKEFIDAEDKKAADAAKYGKD
jgi:hypothetical protein